MRSPLLLLAAAPLAAIAAWTICGSAGHAQTAGSDGLSRSDVPMSTYTPDIKPGRVPERIMHCRLRRATNIDPSRNQAEAEITYEGDFPLTVELPAVHVPEVAGAGTAEGGKVPSAGYRVTADPNKLFEQFPTARFDRVADYWPKHVELGQTIMGKAFQFIILEEVPGQPGKTSIFISRAADAVTIDVTWLFRGQCQLDAI